MKNKLSMKIAVILISLSSFPQISSATSAGGTISHIYVLPLDRVAVQLNGHDRDSLNDSGVDGNGSCIVTNSGTFIVELVTGGSTSETGIAQYALMLSAQAQGKDVYINGANSCLGGRERINWLRIND